jgi:UDP-N-acetylglucosamine acyltransferase
MAEISPHATVEPGATLADDVVVEPFAYIGADVTLEAGCCIKNNATVTGRTRLGEKCMVFPMAVIGPTEDPDQPDGQCVLGDGCSIREHVTIYGGSSEPTRIGRGNLIMIGSQVGSGAQVGSHGIFANFTQVDTGAIVEDFVRTSGFAHITAGVRVGAYTFVSGYTRLERPAPPFAMVQGTPCRIRGVNTQNLKRCGFNDADLRALKSAFREIYNGEGGRARPDAVRDLLARKNLNSHVRTLAETVAAAEDIDV